MSLNRPLRVLICSGNLGNARPDEASIAAWLPDDGRYSDVKDSSLHPLPGPTEHAAILKDLGLPHFQVHNEIIANVRGKDFNDSSEEAVKDDDWFDIIVIGMQEASFEVEPNDPMVRVPVLHPIKKTVFKAVEAGVGVLDSLSRSKDYTKEDNLKVFGSSVNPLEWLAKEDSKVLQELFRSRLPSYDFAVRYQRGEMRLEILVRRDLEVEVLGVKAQNTGIGVNGVLNAANKGGIVAELVVEKHTILSFCTAHLQAHEGKENYLNRIRMAEVIFDGTADDIKGGVWFDLAIKSHFCFMLGDLNFRSELEGDYTKDEQTAYIRKMVVDRNWRALNQVDELFRALRDKDCFVGFETLPCYFPPTFKLEREAGFTYKDQRRPSYTDRILWRTLNKLEACVRPIAYTPISDFTTSDHKPIRGAFEIDLNSPITSMQSGMQERRMMSAQKILTSARSLFGGENDTTSNDATVPQEALVLHMLVSGIKCSIKKRNHLTAQLGPPDPYILFISLPENLVRTDQSKMEMFKGLFRLGTNLHLQTKKKGGKTTRTASGFPRTKKLTGTYNPDWGTEDIHLVVRNIDNDGIVIDASGSILMLCVMDHKPSVADNHVGSFPLNLAHMLTVRPTGQSKRNAEQEGTILGSGRHDNKDVHIMNLKQPLLKNTKQTGWVSCRIETWWALADDDTLAINLSASHSSESDLHRLDRRHDSSGLSDGTKAQDVWLEDDDL